MLLKKLINKFKRSQVIATKSYNTFSNKPRAIIIGNSPNVLENKVGNIIDSFDIVIRLNSFQIEGYEKFVGTKIDKIFITYAVPRNVNFDKTDKKHIYLFAANKEHDKKFLQDRLNHSKVGCMLNLEDINILDSNIFHHELSKKIGLGDKWASTGTIAIEWALKNLKDYEIYIHGFSFFEESGKLLEHYYNVKTRRDEAHNFVKEKEFINNKLNKGRLHRLSIDINELKCEYVIVSHWPKEKNTSPCGSVYDVFLSSNAPLNKKSGHIYTNQSAETVLQEFDKKSDKYTTFIFNGFSSLVVHDSAIELIKKIIDHQNKLIIYWHETAWNFSLFEQRYLSRWKEVFPLLKDYASHWAPTMQEKQLIMYIFKTKFENVKIVGEALKVTTVLNNHNHEVCKTINIGAGGITDYRKGFDYFIKLSNNLTKLDNMKVNYYWHARSSKSKLEKAFKLDMSNINIVDYVADFIQYIYNNYNIYILPSRDDPSPIVAYSALAADVPVFCFDSVGTAELVPEEFVASSLEEMKNNIINYWENRLNYNPGFFNSIALKNTPEEFVKKININYNKCDTNYDLPYK